MIDLKKAAAVFFALLCFCSFSLAAAAADVTIAVGGILVPVSPSDRWHVSTPDAISEDLQEKRSLREDLVRDYMNAFGYALWLTEKGGEQAIIVRAEPSTLKDYAAQSPEELNELIGEQFGLFVSDFPFTASRIERYRAGDLLFLRYWITYEDKPYACYCCTVTDGVEIELRFMLEGREPSDARWTDFENLTDTLAAAFTSPENYEPAPETTTPAPAPTSEPAILLPGGSEDGELDLGEAMPPQTQGGVDRSEPATEESTTRLADPGIVFVGEEGQTLVIEDAVRGEPVSSGITKGRLIAIVVLLAVALALFVAAFIVKKRREKKG